MLEVKSDHDAVLGQLKQEDICSPSQENQDSQQHHLQQQDQHLQQLQQDQQQQRQHMPQSAANTDTVLSTVEITEYSPEWAYPDVRAFPET